MSTEPSKRIWFVRVEAIGDISASTATNELFRWTSAPAPSWDSDGLYQHCLGDGIEIAAQSINPRTGETSSGGMSFALNVELGDPHSVKSIFGRRHHVSLGTVTAEISAQTASGSVQITILGYTTGAGGLIYINRECFRLGTHAGAGVYTSCDRALLETIAQRHRPKVQAYAECKVLRGRRVTLGYYDDSATAYTSEVDVQAYQLWDGDNEQIVSYNFECDGFTAVMGEARLLNQPWIARAKKGSAEGYVMYLNWEPDYRDEGVVRLPEAFRSMRSAANGGSAVERGGSAAEPSSTDRFHVSIDGIVYEAEMTARTAFSGNFDNFSAAVFREPAFGGQGLNLSDGTDFGALDVRECFASDPGGHDNLGASANTLPLGSGVNNHPLGIWLQVVTSTPDGTNGAYDTGIDFGLRLPISWIDVDAAEKIMDTDAEDMRAYRFFAGRESEPALALEKLRKELLQPAGIQQTESTDGRISFTRITDSDYLTTPVDVGEDQLVLAVEMNESFRIAQTLDKLLVRYARDGSGRSRKIPVADNENTEESIGPVDTETIDGGSFQSRDLVLAAGLDYLSRWRNELPSLAFATTTDVNVRCGDAVNLTCLAVIGHDVATDVVEEGVTASRVLITSRQLDIEANMIVYTGLHLGIRDLDVCNVAPALEISGAKSGTDAPVYATNFVGSDHIRGYTDDIDPWTVGDSAAVLSGTDLSVLESGLTIGSLVSGTVGLTGLTVVIADGDFIVPDVYASSTADQQASWEYQDQSKQYEG